MSIKAAIGISNGEDSYITGVNACQQAVEALGAEPGLIILFASSVYDQEKVNAGVRSVSKNALLVGSTTAGEITTEGPAQRHSVAVMAIASDSVKFFGGVGENIAAGPANAGRAMAEAVTKQSGEPLKAFFMLPDVLVGNGADTVRGALSIVGEHFPLAGGASGDDFKFVKSFQHLNDKVYSGATVGLGMAGNLSLGIGVKHGWIPVGVPKKVTKSEGSVLHELDGKPAIAIYEEYFGEEEAAALKKETLAKLAITYPLGMRVAGSEEMLIRDPLTVDEHGSITCAAEIPEGADIQLMVGSREEAIAVAREAAKSALAQLEGKTPRFVVIFNCIARNKLFGERSGEEITAIQEELGAQIPLIGFYTYGEQAPLGGETKNIERCNPAFHNETVVICVVGE